jgi:polyvinyl alcohol dehydrogenase (cytochrome)
LRIFEFLSEGSPSRRVFLVVAGGLLILAIPLIALAAGSASWPSGGQNVSNTHSNDVDKKIDTTNVQNLAVKWTATVHGDVSANPAVAAGAVYVPDWGGYLNKLDANTGATIWSRTITSYTGVPNDASRTSPAIDGNTVYIGDQGTQPAFAGGASVNGGYLTAINATTGNLIWRTRIDTHPNAILTSGPLVANGVVYEGVASSEEGAAADPSYACCTFRGSVVAVKANNGQILWKTYTVPANIGPCTSQSPIRGCGYSGNGVWGTTPALDQSSNTLFITTGNNYTVPDSVNTCVSGGGSGAACLDPTDYTDAVVALNATTGAVKWASRLWDFDAWNVGCIVPPGDNCPPTAQTGPDFDFGSGPNLFSVGSGHSKRLVVGAGQKSGIYYELDAATGQVLWQTKAGPGSSLGGIEWGPATDGQRIYIAEENFYGIPYAIPGGGTITSGSWAALDPATGQILWQVADPSHNLFGGGNALGPVSVGNGVVYVPSLSGKMRALDAATGATLWSFQAAGSVNTGASIVNGVVYWGSGYAHLGIPGWTGSTTFYAFSLNGK